MEWMSVNDRLPEVEKRVLVSVTHHNEYNGKDYVLTTCAIYEDGTVNPEDSIWINQDRDDEFMPAGWWEYHEYGNLEDDGVAFIDGKVTHWMPLPPAPKENA